MLYTIHILSGENARYRMISKHQERKLAPNIVRRSTAKVSPQGRQWIKRVMAEQVVAEAKRRVAAQEAQAEVEQAAGQPATVATPIGNAAVEAAIPLLKERLGTWKYENELVRATGLDRPTVRDALARLRSNGEITLSGNFSSDSTMYILRYR